MQNLSEMMKMSLDFVKNKVNKICGLFNVEFSLIEKWLIENRLEKYQKTEKLFQAIDTDIYQKYLDKKLLEFELKAWANVLDQWRENWVEMLRDYWRAHQKKKMA